jgi:sulfatase modifying factor 1
MRWRTLSSRGAHAASLVLALGSIPACSALLDLQDKQPFPPDAPASADATTSDVSTETSAGSSDDGRVTDVTPRADGANDGRVVDASAPDVSTDASADAPPDVRRDADVAEVITDSQSEPTVTGDAPGTCISGRYHCNGSRLDTCNTNGTGYDPGPTCPAICNEVDGRCDACVYGGPDSCAIDGHSRLTCSSAGQWQTAETRQSQLCVGAGLWVSCLHDTDCPALVPANECLHPACPASQCTVAPLPSTTSCGAGAGMCDGNAGNCVVCPANQLRCSGDNLQRCNSIGTAWQLDTPCGPGLCDSVNLRCNGCSVGTSYCKTGTTRVTCGGNGQPGPDETLPGKFCTGAGMWVDCLGDGDCQPVTLPNECQFQGCTSANACAPKSKPNTATCSSGAGTCDGAGNCLVCSSGDFTCSGSILQTCAPSRTSFSQVMDCGSASLCNAGGRDCYACVPSSRTCDPQNVHNLIVCSADGSTSSTSTDANDFCSNGQFVQCRTASDCATPSNSCLQATCTNAACGTAVRGSGTACNGNGTCDGSGRCMGPVGSSCTAGAPALNCQGLDAAGHAQSTSCCQSMLVGGSYSMGRGTHDDCPITLSCSSLDQPEHPATVTGFYLDEFEVTVGRFRKFFNAYQGPFVTATAGANPRIANSGWDSTWNGNLPSNQTTLLANVIQCPSSSWPAADDPPSPDPEQRPVNCVTWYEAFAFCVWDGGRLPSEAEWEYAAAGGDANLFFPWGNFDASVTVLPVNYFGNLRSAKVPVGSAPGGVGRFGQLDLLGSVNEWVLDGASSTWYASASGNPCNDCADLAAVDIPFRGLRGGAWSSSNATTLRSAARTSDAPTARTANYGIRCAHDKTQ